MTNSPACRASSSLSRAVNSRRVEPAPRRAFYSATRPTASRMVRDTGAILRDGLIDDSPRAGEVPKQPLRCDFLPA